MKIIDKYIIKEFFRIFLLTKISLLTVYIVIDFFEKIDEFLITQNSLTNCFFYFLYKLPLIVFHITPICVLLTTIIIIGIFSKNNEITVMRVCGISLLRTTVPILSIAFIISIALFINSEFIIPYSSSRANHILKVVIRGGKDNSLTTRSKVWFSAPDSSIWNIDYFNQSENILRRVNIFFFREKIIQKRITSEQASWEDGKWLFSNVYVRSFNKDNGIATKFYRSAEFEFPLSIQDIKKVQKKVEEMTIRELYTYINKTISEGFDATKYKVDFHYKIAFPLISFVMSIVGIPFSLKYERNFGITFGIGLSLIIGFSFWIIMSIGVSLGHAGALPPILAAWIANCIYISLGLYLLMSVRQ